MIKMHYKWFFIKLQFVHKTNFLARRICSNTKMSICSKVAGNCICWYIRRQWKFPECMWNIECIYFWFSKNFSEENGPNQKPLYETKFILSFTMSCFDNYVRICHRHLNFYFATVSLLNWILCIQYILILKSWFFYLGFPKN